MLCNGTGVSLLSINEAASTLGLHTVCACVALEVFQKAPMPCILHWDQEYFVVLYKIKGIKHSISLILEKDIFSII